MAATASGHRRFGALDDSDGDLSLTLSGIYDLDSLNLVYTFTVLNNILNIISIFRADDENCASVWSFSVYSAEDYAANTEHVDSKSQFDQENSFVDS